MANQNVPASKAIVAKERRKDELLTILLAVCVASNSTYLKTCNDFANVLYGKPVPRATVQSWFKHHIDNAKELALKTAEASFNGEAPPTPAKAESKAKVPATPRKRKIASDDNEDDVETPPAKSVKGRKATPKAKRVKAEVAEEDCDLLIEEDADKFDGAEPSDGAHVPTKAEMDIKMEVL